MDTEGILPPLPAYLQKELDALLVDLFMTPPLFSNPVVDIWMTGRKPHRYIIMKLTEIGLYEIVPENRKST